MDVTYKFTLKSDHYLTTFILLVLPCMRVTLLTQVLNPLLHLQGSETWQNVVFS